MFIKTTNNSIVNVNHIKLMDMFVYPTNTAVIKAQMGEFDIDLYSGSVEDCSEAFKTLQEALSCGASFLDYSEGLDNYGH